MTARTGRPCPRVLRGCYRDSRLATAPLAVSTAVHRKAWRSLVSAYILISKSQAGLLSRAATPGRPRVRPGQSHPAARRGRYRDGADGRLRRPSGRRQGGAAANGRVGPVPDHGGQRRPGGAAGDRGLGPALGPGGGVGSGPAVRSAARSARHRRVHEPRWPGPAPSSSRRRGKRRSGSWWSRPWRSACRRSPPGTDRCLNSSRQAWTACCSGPATRPRWRPPSAEAAADSGPVQGTGRAGPQDLRAPLQS